MKRTYPKLRPAMTLDERLVGIIAGCISAGVVLLIAIIILVYCLCRKHRREKTMAQVERNLSSDTLGNSEVPSTLPKVGSNGLWIPSQSMLAATPSSAYAQAKPGSKQRDIIYRASSEPRVAEAKGQGYQGNLRIYHSQQLAPLYEVYEPGRYDRYMGIRPASSPLYDDDRLYHSQAMLIENGYQMNHVYEKEVETSGRSEVRRSASDATSIGRFNDGRAASRVQPYPDKNFKAVVEVHQPRGMPVRSHWGQNRGPNKERQPPPNKPKTAQDYVADHSLTRKAEIPVDYLGTQTGSAWESPPHYRTADSRPSATVYSPEDRGAYQANTVPRYQDSHEENFKLELKTTYSSQAGARSSGVDQGVQVGMGVSDMMETSHNDTVSSKHTDLDEDGGYFTSSGRTDVTLSGDHSFHNIPKPTTDVDGHSDVTDLASKGKHVTAEAFEFLDHYLSDVSG